MSIVGDVIADAKSKLGAPYVWGAEGPNTFDCSGLVQWAYGRHGVKLPRTAAQQAKVGQAVPWGQQAPGDLIFSTWDSSPDVDHVAIYLGGGQYINAPKAGDVVKIGKITDGYAKHVTGVRRVVNSAGGIGLPAPDDIGGAIGGAVGGAVGKAIGDGSITDSLLAIADAARTMATGAVNVGGLAAQLAKLALPTNALRMASGLIGVVLIFSGIMILGREVKS